MKVYQGVSALGDACAVVGEATAGWPVEAAPGLVLVFCSTSQDAGQVASAVAERFPAALVVGCTTSGEHLSGRHYNGATVITAVESDKIRWSAERVDGLAGFDDAKAERAAASLFEALQVDVDNFNPARFFALLFVDGLSMREEVVASLLADALEGVTLLGGSAGDDLAFEKTCVIFGGEAVSDAAVVVLAESDEPFEIFKHQHFTTRAESVVITRADTQARRVYEMDGYPALEAYARALGMAPEDVDGDVTFLNPVTFRSGGQIYVRSIQRIEDDGSIVFYCGVEEGMVLDIGGHQDMAEALDGDLSAVREKLGKAELIIAFNCILRALEATGGKKHDTLGALIQRATRHTVGFDTYGEQLNGLHINQTLVALAIGQAA